MNHRLMTALGIASALFLGNGCKSMGFMTGSPEAVCQISGLDNSQIKGKATFTQEADDVLVEVELDGLSPGKHGIHIHEHGDCGGVSGASAGGHFDVLKHNHGAAGMVDSHEGDLGNIVADSKGHARLSLADKWLRLSGDQSILGRSIVVHAGEDDQVSQPAGNSGARVACGLITAAIR